MGHLVRFVLCFRYFGAPLLRAIFRLPGVSRALRQLLFETPVGIKLSHRKATFCALVHVGGHPYFLSQRDLECAQDTFFREVRNHQHNT